MLINLVRADQDMERPAMTFSRIGNRGEAFSLQALLSHQFVQHQNGDCTSELLVVEDGAAAGRRHSQGLHVAHRRCGSRKIERQARVNNNADGKSTDCLFGVAADCLLSLQHDARASTMREASLVATSAVRPGGLFLAISIFRWLILRHKRFP
jgi:hypothetical protein